MFTNICKHFANVHLHLQYITYVHEQFTKYHKLLLKVHELGGNFCISTSSSNAAVVHYT